MTKWWRHRPESPLPSREPLNRMRAASVRLHSASLRLIVLVDEIRDELDLGDDK